uniref:CopG family transcriptional regulator n=1 Tax=Tolypothrix bouteillei VB521301 TaxID=1479485 RepID=A0A0C1RKU1_9CYAN
MVLKAKKVRRDTEQKNQAIEEATKEETSRLNAEIPVSLHNKIKMRAIEEGRGSSITSIVIKALTAYLDTPVKER